MQRRQQIEQDARKKISDPYDVDYFAKKHGISLKDAARIINLHRSDRDSSVAGDCMAGDTDRTTRSLSLPTSHFANLQDEFNPSQSNSILGLHYRSIDKSKI
ncbi:hypothetical protein [Neorhizobium galegae]|uniref:hypothetical protein n=1 Tax=Neorhizobium galegae TaxID=399 RepID=UPI002101DC5A|nr:hypothetical protein [Neorhizobium galegae]MCQ1855023.1 hypothetical protein [Neorhizobium galegae]